MTRTTSSTRPTRPTSAAATAQERFDRRLSAKRRRTWKLLGVLALLIALGAGAWWALWRSDWLLTEAVVVTGVEERWVAQVHEAADIPMSQPLVEIDTDGAEARVAEVPIVRTVSVVRSWPNTITVKVEPREPVLGVRQPSGHVALVDADGVTIETVSRAPDGMPVVESQIAGDDDEDAYRAAWTVVSGLPEALSDQITTITVSGPRLITFQIDERTLVWGGPEDGELKAEVAGALLATDALRIDVSSPRTPVTEGTVAVEGDGEESSGG